MNPRQFRMLSLFLAISLVLVPISQAMAQSSAARPAGALTLPVSGTVVNTANESIGQFTGSFTINRFAKTSTNQIVAVGFVRGVVTSAAGQVTKSGLQAIVLPVNLSRASAINFKTPLSGGPQMMRASLTTAGSGRFMLAQATSCGILHLDIGGNAVNLLGVNVNLTPITLDLSGDSAGPLGALVCQILALLGSVADVVGLLNSILGLLTGLLGGLTGGLGGGLGI
ncbi:MAG TPA: hypothetical protein VE422_13105 [Terriglobia bacterium]|nr:hypothetical protein [Terriglobia bacterium]